jgi:DNA-binding beta-propeller fold protein YncE
MMLFPVRDGSSVLRRGTPLSGGAPLRGGLPLIVLGSLVAMLPSCGGGGGGSGSSNRISVELVSNGFSGPPLIPHQTYAFDATTGQPNRNRVIEIRSMDDLLNNVRSTNPVHAPSVWRVDANSQPILPNGSLGNHFLLIQFSTEPDIDSIFDPTPAGQNSSGLLGTITISRVDSTTGSITPIRGRGFLGGVTPDGLGGYQTWVEVVNSRVTDVSPNGEASGFPGVASPFSGDTRLVDPKSFVFIPDLDGDLGSFETYPLGFQTRVEVTSGVLSRTGRALTTEVLCAGCVSADTYTPEAIAFDPQNGAEEVDPLTSVRVEFSEPVQPNTVGEFPGPFPPGLSSAVSITFGPQTSRISVPYTAIPESPYNLARYVLTPLFNFPGRDPLRGTIQALNEITVQVNPQIVKDLVEEIPQQQITANVNLRTPAVLWTVGDGPGLVNAPVSPSTVYIGRVGGNPGLSVIDLYGFGQSTGDPSPDNTLTPQLDAGNTFIYNPNLSYGANIVPPISSGTTTIDGGSGGFLTLTRDSALTDLLVRAPLVLSVDDIHIGHPLDKLFNNSSLECRSGGGNVCAATGPLHNSGGAAVNGNTIGVAPHPNPPKLVFPPICVAPFIQGEEPTLDSRSPLQPAVDLLGLGDPFGRPAQGVPPSGLLVDNDGFFGPVPPALNGGIPTACSPYAIRQQIGHFLYVVDRSARQVKVFNSNRMTIVDEIDVPDPTDLAISGNLRALAVTNFASNTVTIIDIDPASPTFHTVLKTVPVGGGPRGCAFHSENEDLFVVNYLGNSVTVIRQLDFEPRKVITNQINRPIDVAVTPRQINFGFNTGLYFAYFLNQSGNIAVMESGPDGTNGIGYDDVIGIVAATFPSPQSIQVDPVDFNSAVWITHVDSTGRGAVSRLALTDSPVGPLPLSVTSGGIILPPSFRDRGFSIVASYDYRKLTAGFPSDTALDNLTNLGPVGGLSTPQAGVPGATQDGKTLYRIIQGAPVQVSFPTLLFIANPAGGVIDVIDLRNANLLRSIPASGARHVADYWRQ